MDININLNDNAATAVIIIVFGLIGCFALYFGTKYE